MADNEVSIKITGDATEVKDAADTAKEHLDRVSESVEMLGNLIGIKIPDALQKMAAESEIAGPILEAAFPVLALISFGTAIIEAAEKFAKLREEAETTAEDQIKLETTINNTFNSLDEKLLEAGIKSDELRHDHIAALKKELELVNLQNMNELVQSFDKIAKQADITFADLKAHMYELGIGSAGAQHALAKFKTEYESLLAQGKDKEASDLLAGTLKSAQHILDLQKEGQQILNTKGLSPEEAQNKFKQQAIELAKAGVGITEKEVESQKALVDALSAQVVVEEKVAELKKKQDSNDVNATAKTQVDQATKNYGLFKTAQEEALKSEISNLKEAESAAIVSFTAQGDTMDEAKAKADAIYGPQVLQARLDFYARLSGAAVTQAEKDRIAAEAHIALNEAEQQSNDKLAQAQARLTAKDEQEAAREKAAVKQAMDLADQRMIALTAQSELAQSLGDKRIATINKEIEALQKLIASGKLNGDLTASAYGRIHQLEVERQKDINADLIGMGKLGNVMKGTLGNMAQDFSQWQQKIGQTFQQTVNSMNKDLATFVTTGKASFADLAASAIESILEILIQQGEAWAAAEIKEALGLSTKKATDMASVHSSAAVTYAEVFAALSASGIAGVAAAPGAASAASSAVITGALGIANWDIGTNFVPMDGLAFLHRGEQVIPADKQGPGYSGGFGGGSTIVVQMSVNAIDSQSFQGSIRKHGNMIANEVTRALKRKGVNA